MTSSPLESPLPLSHRLPSFVMRYNTIAGAALTAASAALAKELPKDLIKGAGAYHIPVSFPCHRDLN